MSLAILNLPGRRRVLVQNLQASCNMDELTSNLKVVVGFGGLGRCGLG